MSRKFVSILKVALVFLGLILCILGSNLFYTNGLFTQGIVGKTIRQAMIACNNPETQWMAMLCASMYFVTFTWLQFHHGTAFFWRVSNPNLWLMAALLVGGLAYTFNYSTSSQSVYALTLLAGAVIGQGVAVWAGIKSGMQKAECSDKMGSRVTRSSDMEWGLTILIVTVLVIILALASVWQSDAGHVFEYHSHTRWSGPWDNPNIFGLLMGVGITLAFSLAASSVECRVSIISEAEQWKKIFWKWGIVVLCLVAAVLMGRGLLHSYSRGAWLATGFGLAYLMGSRVWVLGSGGNCEASQISNSSTLNPQLSTATPNWFHRNWLPLAAIVFCVGILFFWQFRQTAWHPAHRAFSVGNQNDFSWRNRLSAWEAALQITAEHPGFGAGWNQPKLMYEHYYLPPKVTESAAIEMNDYLLLGATLGIPALFCFATYIWISLFKNSAFSLQPLELLPATCRAGAIVLLVGFWFDGGLFKLATASTFWILLELGSISNHEIREPHEND